MKEKTSIRYFNKKPVRSRWDEKSCSWLVCAIDLIDAVVETNNPRIYWYTIKNRHSELLAKCKQLKMTASDGKLYDMTSSDEKDLEKGFPEHLRPKAHHWLILHGRYVCQSRKPHCGDCGISDICEYHKKFKE